MRSTSLASVTGLLLVFTTACGDDGATDGGATDSGVMDSAADTGPADSSSGDTSTGDSGTMDSATDSAADTSTDMPVTLQFAARVGSEDFGCGTTYSGLGTTSAEATGGDFRFYVSDVRLVTSTDDEVPVALTPDGMFQSADVSLLDFEDGTSACMSGNSALNSEVVGTVAPGEYTGVRFVVGVPFELNHVDVATAETPLNITSMFWNWQGGYKFLRIDLVVGSGGYNMHLGSTMCTSGAPTEPPTAECMRPNRMEVSLDGFDIDTSVIVADLAELVSDADLTANTMGTPPGCQSFPTDETDCLPVFPKLGLDYATGVAGSTAQSFFHLE